MFGGPPPGQGGPPPGSGATGFVGGGFSPGGPGFGNSGGNTGPSHYALGGDDYVTVILPLKPQSLKPIKFNTIYNRENIGLPGHFTFQTDLGTTYIDANQKEIIMDYKGIAAPGQPDMFPSPHDRLLNRKRNNKDQSPEGMLQIAEWCLEVGLPDECKTILDSLAASSGANFKSSTKRAIDAYNQIKNVLTSNVESSARAQEWKERLGYASVTVSPHYAIVHADSPSLQESADRRLGYLEMNFKTVYLWFALRGRALPAPTEKLVAVIVGESSEFRRYRDTFEATNLVADGFHARRENLAVFSARRLDRASMNFETQMAEVKRKFNVKELMAGKLPTKGDANAPKYAEFARASTLVMVDAALQREAEIAAATHEGTKQIFAETGLLPRNVLAPEWLKFGIAALFEMPKGPFPGGAGQVKVAAHPGGGGPNWAYMRYFEEMKDSKILTKDKAIDAFIKTVLDAHYMAAKRMERIEKEIRPGEEGESKSTPSAQLYDQARTYSWAVVYFLAKEHFDRFEKLLAEISALPRDAELDADSVINAFARAYDVAYVGLTGSNADPKKFMHIGEAWWNFMSKQQSPSRRMKIDTVIANPGASGTGFGPGGTSPGGAPPGFGPPSGPGGPGGPGGGPPGPGRPGG